MEQSVENSPKLRNFFISLRIDNKITLAGITVENVKKIYDYQQWKREIHKAHAAKEWRQVPLKWEKQGGDEFAFLGSTALYIGKWNTAQGFGEVFE